MAERVRDLYGSASGLEDLAEAAGKSIQVAEDLRMSSNSIPGAGREPGVVGRVFGMEAGQVSSPIEGENAVFVLRVNDISMADPSEMTESNRNQIRNQLEQQKFGAFSSVFIDKLKEEASIRDNRNRVMSR